jgi:hypothetical protein
MNKTIEIGLALGLALVACGKKDKDGGSSGGGGDVDVAGANAAIPAAWKGKLEFSVQRLGEGKFNDPVNVAAPKGWKKGFMEGSLEPPEGNSEYGFGTSFKAGGTCAGDCTKPKSEAEWVAAGDSTYFSGLGNPKPPEKIAKDDKGAGHRTLIVENGPLGMGSTSIIVAKWTDGGDRMYTCKADLSDKGKDLAPAFEKACLTVVSAK